MAGAFLCLLTSQREKRHEILMAVVRPTTLALIALVTIPALLSSLFYRPTLYPFEYGIVTVVTLIGARILLSAVGFEGVLLSFFYATTAGILIVAGINFSDLLASIGSTRFAPLFYDPNRIAFFAVTSIPAQLWFVSRRRRYARHASFRCLHFLSFVAGPAAGLAEAWLSERSVNLDGSLQRWVEGPDIPETYWNGY